MAGVAGLVPDGNAAASLVGGDSQLVEGLAFLIDEGRLKLCGAGAVGIGGIIARSVVGTNEKGVVLNVIAQELVNLARIQLGLLLLFA